jgi:hypothetical protein
MRFRLKLFALHFLSSCCVLGLVWGALYLGWYRWPGWYVSGVLGIAAIMAGVDVVLGPLLTLIIANPGKSRRVLARDIGVIAAVQLVALVYGAVTLWHGRPLYYTYSEGWLQMVPAGDISAQEAALGRQLNPRFAPHWYSLPRWIYAPLPKDTKLADQIVESATLSGGDDVIQMPRFYRPWEEAAADIRNGLRILSEMRELGVYDKERVAQRMKEAGFDPGRPCVLPMYGRVRPLVGVMDPATGELKTLIRVD